MNRRSSTPCSRPCNRVAWADAWPAACGASRATCASPGWSPCLQRAASCCRSTSPRDIAMPLERRWGWGPGIVFLLTAIGPQDLVSNSAAGAEFQYALLWALVPVLVIRYAILEASSRYVLATGESLMAGYARMGRWLMVVLFVAILAKRLVSGLYQVVMLGQAIDFMVPPGLQGHQTVWALASWGLGFAVLWWGRYRTVEWASVPLLMLLGGSIVLAAIGSRPDWGRAF